MQLHSETSPQLASSVACILFHSKNTPVCCCQGIQCPLTCVSWPSSLFSYLRLTCFFPITLSCYSFVHQPQWHFHIDFDFFQLLWQVGFPLVAVYSHSGCVATGWPGGHCCPQQARPHKPLLDSVHVILFSRQCWPFLRGTIALKIGVDFPSLEIKFRGEGNKAGGPGNEQLHVSATC